MRGSLLVDGRCPRRSVRRRPWIPWQRHYDIVFITVTVGIASAAIVNGIRKHGSYRPAILFGVGLVCIVVGHSVYRHEHGSPHHGIGFEDVVSTTFSVAGGLALVGFHLLNMRLLKCKRPSN